MKNTKKQYTLNDILNFGKYRNRTLRSVLDTDHQYIFSGAYPTYQLLR